jgi:DNA topoisomerase-1
MPKNLLIVESPAKAKTIEKYLGKDYKVKSSYGHIRDLAKGNSAVEVDNNFKLNYVVSDDKKKVVKDLKTAVKQSDEVWLATDEDREGEAISWHLCEVLGLDPETTKRIVFREITQSALVNAIQNPRKVNKGLVNAQQARRVLDRLVGFELSSILWRKVASRGGLSAGRVQSVAVKLIVEREREIQKFEAEPFYRVVAFFYARNHLGKNIVFKAELPTRYKTQGHAENFLEACKKATYNVHDIKIRPSKRRPAAPFTTSTLQQEASRKLGFSVSRTMSNAQRLYEAGHITYMRTDSVNLSETALKGIAKAIDTEYGANYVQIRRYKKKKNDDLAQEAHEAIRPTYPDKSFVTTDRDQQRLYELIWKRTIASQMADAEIEKTTAEIDISTVKSTHLVAQGEVIKFDGFLKVYLESTDEEPEEQKGMLPPLEIGQQLSLQEMKATERFSRPPSRFTEASLVKKLEELGIGRPSTYAPTISKITEKGRGCRERHYTVLTLKDGKVKTTQQKEITGAEKNKLFPSDLGKIVSDFLSIHFQDIMDYGFTADIEKRFDKIAHGKEQWRSMLNEFYQPFEKKVKHTLEKADRMSGERILGKDKESGHTVLARMSRNGAVIQIGTPEELGKDKPKYSNLKTHQSIETITFEEAIDLFKLPITIGEYEGQDVVINEGRFGPYVLFDKKFHSLDKGEDPMEVSMERAITLIEAKRKADAPIAMYKGKPVQQGKGRFGPYLKWNDWFVNIPRRYDPDNLSQDDINELLAAKEEKEANRYIHIFEEEQITVENARWGPIIKFKKKTVKIPKKDDGKRVTPEEAKVMTLDEFKQIILAEISKKNE